MVAIVLWFSMNSHVGAEIAVPHSGGTTEEDGVAPDTP